MVSVWEQGSAHDRFRLDCGRMVAFRRDADHILAEPEGVAHLLGRGEEGNDPHAARPSDTPRPLKALFKRTRRRCPGWTTGRQCVRALVVPPESRHFEFAKRKGARGLPYRALSMSESLRI